MSEEGNRVTSNVFIFGGTKLQVTVTENVNNVIMACYARVPL